MWNKAPTVSFAKSTMIPFAKMYNSQIWIWLLILLFLQYTRVYFTLNKIVIGRVHDKSWGVDRMKMLYKVIVVPEFPAYF